MKLTMDLEMVATAKIVEVLWIPLTMESCLTVESDNKGW